jgi:segregation and condensation protein B
MPNGLVADPGTQDRLHEPEVSQVQEVPQVPEVPEVPQVPEVPEVPQVPEVSQVQECDGLSRQLLNILEAAMLSAGQPLGVRHFQALFPEIGQPTTAEIRAALTKLALEYEGRGIELVEVAGGFRLQVRGAMRPWIEKLWPERPPKYSRALLETLAIIAYRQPVTRGEIEDIRGVAVSSQIIRTLQERGWIRVVGVRDVPGRPEMLGTTRAFLDYFSLQRLEDLPVLSEGSDYMPTTLEPELPFGEAEDAAPAHPLAGSPDDAESL